MGNLEFRLFVIFDSVFTGVEIILEVRDRSILGWCIRGPLRKKESYKIELLKQKTFMENCL
jgi:hypothetical protein